SEVEPLEEKKEERREGKRKSRGQKKMEEKKTVVKVEEGYADFSFDWRGWREQQGRLKTIYDRQLANDGIIDVEKEAKKNLVTEDDVVHLDQLSLSSDPVLPPLSNHSGHYRHPPRPIHSIPPGLSQPPGLVTPLDPPPGLDPIRRNTHAGMEQNTKVPPTRGHERRGANRSDRGHRGGGRGGGGPRTNESDTVAAENGSEGQRRGGGGRRGGRVSTTSLQPKGESLRPTVTTTVGGEGKNENAATAAAAARGGRPPNNNNNHSSSSAARGRVGGGERGGRKPPPPPPAPINPVSLVSECTKSVEELEKGKIAIRIHAKPGARVSAVTDCGEEEIGVAIGAPPREGQANETLIEFMMQTLGVRRSEIDFDKGARSRTKIVIVSTERMSRMEIVDKLRAAVGK
ncbi:hypothetical protein PFISCL1PPCAC_10890, partial [Pristionchus fissidentatus]